MAYTDKTIKINHGKTLIVAHTGFGRVEVQNTIQAFNLASSSSAYGIECDVHATKDGKFIVIHDSDLKRLTGQEGVVEELTFDKLRKIPLIGKNDVPDENYRMPSLEEYLIACKNGNKRAVIELKDVDYENSKNIARFVIDFGYLDSTTFISFNTNCLDAVREVAPDCDVQFLTGDFDIDLIPMLVKKKWDLDIYYPALTKERIDALHELGIKVNAWTVNEKDIADLLIYWGIDMITSDIFE